MKLVAIDLETHKIQPGLLAPPGVCVSAAWRESSGATDSVLHYTEQGIEVIHSFIQSLDVTLCGANIAYDFGCLLATRPSLLPKIWSLYEQGRVFDILIAGTLDALAEGRLRDDGLFLKDGTKIPSGRYSLSMTVQDYLKRKDAKKNDRWRTSYALLENTPLRDWPEDALQYPIDDARNTLEVAEVQRATCKNLQNQSAQVHAAFCAHLGAIWGIKIDAARVEALRESNARLQDVHKAFQRAVGFAKLGGTKKAPKWTKDMAAIRARVLEAYEGRAPKTEKGEVSTSRETLEDSGDPELEKLAAGSKFDKIAVYADTLSELKGKPMNVRCNILLATGRASYEGLIQLMPRQGGVRECCVARPGTVWSSVDYAAIEMSTLAQVQLWALGRSKLAEAINADLDPHSIFGSGMTQMSYDEFLKRKKEPQISNLRQAAKAANFGFPGMMGAAKFVIAKRREGASVCRWTNPQSACGAKKIWAWKYKELESPLCAYCLEQAEKLRNAYLRQWPEMRLYWDWVVRKLREGGDSLTQFVSERVRGGLSGPAASNTLFQGLAADGAKAAVVALTKEMYLDSKSPLFGSRLMVFAHDETILEIPEEKAHEAAHRQAEIMVSAMRHYVPDVKVKAEPALMRAWSKKAEAVYKDGRLVPWEESLDN